ncbi:MAG: 2-hydroxychromene-2-carboxylate isomerase [Minwuia sp.]|nr:2-hydroxychromene-2-carboxylate isomerase [Minwuia sp.]
MSKAEFHFDFASPNSYMSHCVVPQIAARTGVQIDYVPVLLGGLFRLTNNKSPMEQNAGVLNKSEYGRLEMGRFIARHKLDRFVMNPHFPMNTVALMRGALVAGRDGFATDYINTVFQAMWEDGLKMDDPEVMTGALDKAGMDGAAILAGTQDQAIKDQLMANTKASADRGNFGSPTFFAGDEMYFGKDRLRDFEEEIVRQRDAA